MENIKQENIGDCKVTYKESKSQSLKLFVKLLSNTTNNNKNFTKKLVG